MKKHVLWWVGAGVALAGCGSQEVLLLAEGQQFTTTHFWKLFFDNALSITILFIFISAIIGTILKNLAVDKCLKHFDEFHVTLELTDGDFIWGTLKMYSTGLELFYRAPRFDADGHFETSYVLYGSEYDKIQAICRYHGDLTPKRRKKRERDIRKTYRPSLLSRMLRSVRNSVNTFSDAFSKALSLIIGHMKKTSPGSVILKQDAQIAKLGNEIIGYAGNAYDPILERYIGKKVVIEVHSADQKQEFLGILKEYTPVFLELLNVTYPFTVSLPLKGKDAGKQEISGVTAQAHEGSYVISNHSVTPVHVRELVKNGAVSALDIEIAPGETSEIIQDGPDLHTLAVTITTRRLVDIIVPRSKALIRHAGPRERVGWKELLGFDEIEYFFGKFKKEA